MIDLHLLREDPEGVAAALARRGLSGEDFDNLVALEVARRELLPKLDEARSAQKAASQGIGKASSDERPALIEQASQLKSAVAELEAQSEAANAAFDAVIVSVPNLPHPDAPDGNEGDGIILRTVGQKPTLAEPKDHQDLMEAAGVLDLEAGRVVSGARFAYLKGEAVMLEFALVRYAMDIAMKHGHVPVIPPVLVREEALYNTGFFPADEQQVFATRDDDLYLVGTAEVPLAGLHTDHIFEPDDVPVRYAGFSTCFRREAGTYGKDTRGIFRVHQFDKVELFAFVDAASSDAEHQRILAIEEEVIGGLELHYQVVDIPIGDLGSSAARKFDIEVWLPGQQAFRELTSCSNTTDYQSRRLKARVRGEHGNELVHTLNGTACAVGRTMIALIETHQREDGTVAVPAALQPYFGKDTLFA
ncbi:MAG: seryl-tRNA synthetase [Glaciecola sp.]|jgi:seryl-tRNA synthetase